MLSVPYVPPARPSIRTRKSFQYRGSTRVFGNRWFFNGGVPASNTEWDTLAAAVLSHEQDCYGTDVTFVDAVCYDSGSDVPVYTHTYSASGSYSPGSEVRMPGDCAGIVRMSTDARSTKNHPIYLYKFCRAVYREVGATFDTWSTFQSAHWKSLIDNWIAGLSDGAHTLTLADAKGLGAVSSLIEPLITHRDFPR
jgi:hypothetical protein